MMSGIRAESAAAADNDVDEAKPVKTSYYQ